MVMLEALDADHGDCLLLHYETKVDNEKIPQLWLIDGGPPGVWNRVLRKRLACLPQGRRRIRLGVVTHIDSDHIGGLDRMIAALVANPRRADTPDVDFVEFWFNGFTRLMDAATAASTIAALERASDDCLAVALLESAREGERLRINLAQLGAGRMPALLNPGFEDGRVLAPRHGHLVGGVTVDLLTPTQAQFDALKTEWAKQLDVSAAELAAAERRDSSPTNRSSIAFLARVEDRTILFTGDALAEDLIEGWKKLGDPPKTIDIMKVPHHGATSNNSRELFELIPARHYVFCANGRDGNPDLATLEMLFAARPDGDYRIHLTTTRDTSGIADQVSLLEEKAPGRVNYRQKDHLSLGIDL